MKNKIIILIGAFILSILFNQKAYAATGYEGYAVYRDGVYYVEWHAGLMDDPYIGYTSQPVVHTPGWDGTGFASWSQFLNGNTFKGVYKPRYSVTSADRDLFKAMGRNLAWRNISYNAGYQIWYDLSSVGTYVDYSEISSMRCDGVVEFVYQWYEFPVWDGISYWGHGRYWDITLANANNRETHGGTLVTPKKQTNYLTRVTPYEPY